MPNLNQSFHFLCQLASEGADVEQSMILLLEPGLEQD